MKIFIDSEKLAKNSTSKPFVEKSHLLLSKLYSFQLFKAGELSSYFTFHKTTIKEANMMNNNAAQIYLIKS